MAIQNSTFRDGYQPFSRQTFAPLSEDGQFSGSFTQKPSSQAPSDASPSIPNQPSTMSPAPAQPSGPSLAGQNPAGTAGYQTFAQMQSQGIPRPAPPAPAAPSPVQGALQQSVLGALGNPSRYGAPEMQAQFSRMSQDIDDDYALKQRAVDEQMAGRGLYDSTMAGGQLSDLNVGRRSAKTDLAQRIADSGAQTYGQDRASAIASALGLFGQEQQGSQFDRTLDYNQRGQENSTLMSLLNAIGSGNLGSLGSGDLGALLGGAGGAGGGGMGSYLGDLIPQAQAGTLGPSIGGVGGPGGFGVPSGPSMSMIPSNTAQFAPAPTYGRGSTAGTIGQRAGESTVYNFANGAQTGDSSGLSGPTGGTLDQARQSTYDSASNPANEQARQQYILMRYYGGDRDPALLEQMRELGLA